MSSLESIYHFRANETESPFYWPEAISIYRSEILVASPNPPFKIYNKEGYYLRKVTTEYTVRDARWTPDGNILCSTFWPSCMVVLLTPFGEFITSTKMESPQFLSVSTQNVIHLADSKNGVYHSTDYGRSWNFLFKPNNSRHCKQVIEVSTDQTSNYWLIERTEFNVFELHVYGPLIHSDVSVSWTEISIACLNTPQVLLSFNSRIAYDGDRNIFMCDQFRRVVHVFSSDGQYHRQLLSSSETLKPQSLFVDVSNTQLYVGQMDLSIYVYKIIYSKNDDFTKIADKSH